MASPEHLASSDFIKSVHQKLREDAKLLGTDKAWKTHCENEDCLKKYATAMHDLAANHWENNYKTSSKPESRVEWVYQFSQSYFLEGYLTQRQRETEIADKINLQIPTIQTEETNWYKLLDVGSCYNPFKKYTCFDVLPIDIAPATSDVYKCDFLHLNVSNCAPKVTSSTTEISELPSESFDVVVFSLLLEYLPSPNQRLLCCKNAYSLLRVEGILFIITPDSKHVGANAKIMKSWRFILAKIGFSRIKYEKLAYLHCMVFRKSIKPEIAQRWAKLQDESHFYSEFVIPQDFRKDNSPVEETSTSCEFTLFDELPNSVE